MNKYNMKNTRKKSIGLQLTSRMDTQRTAATFFTNETSRTYASSLKRKKSMESLEVKQKPLVNIENPQVGAPCLKFQIRHDTARDQTHVLADLVSQNRFQQISHKRTQLGSIENIEGSRHQLRASSAPKMSFKSRSHTESYESLKQNRTQKQIKKKSIRVDINLEDIIMEHVKKAPDINRQIQTIFVKGLRKKLEDIQKQSRRMNTHPTPTFRNLVATGTLETLKNKLGTQSYRLSTQNTTCESLNSSTLFR